MDSRRISLGRRAGIVLATATATALLLSSCTEPPEANPGATAASRPAKNITVVPGTSKDGYVGAVADAHLTACSAKGDEWYVKGTVANSKNALADYRIYVSFLDPSKDAGNNTAGVVQVDVRGVGANKSRDWSRSVPLHGKDLSCVLRVEKTVQH